MDIFQRNLAHCTRFRACKRFKLREKGFGETCLYITARAGKNSDAIENGRFSLNWERNSLMTMK